MSKPLAVGDHVVFRPKKHLNDEVFEVLEIRDSRVWLRSTKTGGIYDSVGIHEVVKLTDPEDAMVRSFTRPELQALRKRCLYINESVTNPFWKHAYLRLAFATDSLDAMLARTEERED